ncbi:MAG: hypothetical protein AB8C13_09215 [Phycisphaerales bacterium]
MSTISKSQQSNTMITAQAHPKLALTGLHDHDQTSELNLSKQEILSQTISRRDHATKLLSSLLEAKSVSERNLATLNQDDLLKRVTGNSSLDNAVASTRKLIDSFNRVIDDLRRNLSDEELADL